MFLEIIGIELIIGIILIIGIELRTPVVKLPPRSLGTRSGGITACREHKKEFVKYEISYLQTFLPNCVNV